MRASGVGNWFVAAASVFMLSACVSKGCPPGHVLVAGACVVPDAGALDAGDARNIDRVVSFARDADTLGDEDAGDVWSSADGGADSGAFADAAADASGAADPDPCDGGVSTRCWRDGDEDGHAALDAGEMVVCDDKCPALWTDLEPVSSMHDCVANDPSTYPGRNDVCNDVDDDCDMTVDEGAGATCPYDHGSGACNSGICELAACDEGWDDCDTLESTGCEQMLTSRYHCGACGLVCHDLGSCVDDGSIGSCECDIATFGDGVECKGPGPLAAGATASCGIHTGNNVTCWGSGPTSPPAASFRQVAIGTEHACGIETNDDVDCWGVNANGQVKDLVGSFEQVAVGVHHSCALRRDRSILCWGISKTNPGASEDYDQALNPSGLTYRQITAGLYHNCALRLDGTILCWGSDGSGQSTPPEGVFVQVAAGGYHTCALRADGSVTCWGAGKTDTGTTPEFGQSLVPGGASFEYLSAGAFHTCGITSDGTMICWGAGDTATISFIENGQSMPPDGSFLRVYAGAYHTCALDNQFKAVCWGGDMVGQSDAPGNTWPLIP